jgi:hypothetical protein
MIQSGRKNINNSVERREFAEIRGKNIIEYRKKVPNIAPESAI